MEKSTEKANFATGVSCSSEIFLLEQECPRTIFKNQRLSRSSENSSLERECVRQIVPFLCLFT